MLGVFGLLGIAMSAFVFSNDDGEEMSSTPNEVKDEMDETTGDVVLLDEILDTDDEDVVVSGNDAGDIISTGAGDDHGHIGDDNIRGDAGDDEFNGGAGDDTLLGSLGDDALVGGEGADTLHGGSGDDVLSDRGDNMRDFLNGGAGNDVLMGDAGDHLHGGTGIDPPELSTGASDAGLTLLADGDLVATFSNLDGLDVTIVSLVAA